MAAWLLTLLALMGSAAEPHSELYAEGFVQPVSLKFVGARAYIVEQHGTIRTIVPGKDGRAATASKTAFLDITDRVSKFSGSSERGLFDAAFDADFERSGRFFVHYTDREGDTVVSEFRAEGGRAGVSTERVILQVKQPYSNHNGGALTFGPDGYLYLALGDGGSKGDPHDNGQKLNTFLGKILRFDVSARGEYKVPADNPFAKNPNARGEIWAYGLRNPWRMSFDGHNLYIADVGQNRFEEINVEDIRKGGGRNYGWRVVEGPECYNPKDCDKSPYAAPTHSYRLYVNGECTVIGGYVYRGGALPELKGRYFYADFCTGLVSSFLYKGGKAVGHRRHPALNPDNRYWENVSSFGRDDKGELYVVGYDTGRIYRLVP